MITLSADKCQTENTLAMALINLGLENRKTACTNMNTTSSRSHTVLTIKLDRSHKTLQESCLHLVDLAGSERTSSDADLSSERFAEARAINSSLSALGNVVAALACAVQSSHIPYRDSKLTRLLQRTLDSHSGANTALIATVGPAHENSRESWSTLKFASRCMRVRKIVEVQPKQEPTLGTSETRAQLVEKVRKLHAEQQTLLRVHQEELEAVRKQHDKEQSKWLELHSVVDQNRQALVSFLGNLPESVRQQEELVRLIETRCRSERNPTVTDSVRQDCSLFRHILSVVQTGRKPATHAPEATEESWSFVLKYLLDSNEKLRRQVNISN